MTNWYKRAQEEEKQIVPPLNISEDDYYNIAETMFDSQSSTLQRVIDSFRESRGRGHQPWKVVPLARVKKIWLDYVKTGFVRDVNGLNEIANQILENVSSLIVNTQLAGHTQLNPKAILEDAGIRNLTEKQWEKFYNWMETKYGTPFSDYSLDVVEQDAARILHSKTPEEKLIAIDRLFNRVHRRGDLAALFIEKGSSGLTELYEQGYVRPPEKDWNLYR